jgi:hypothetical protein
MFPRAFAAVLVPLCCLLAAATCGGGPTDGERDLAVGKKMPVHVTDFVNSDRGDCGCPAVMIANARARGVIIWVRGADEAAFDLAKAIDGKPVDGKKVFGFLVAFDVRTEGLALKARGVEHVIVGGARHSAKEEWDGRGVEPGAGTLVFLLDEKEIRGMWSFRAGELTDARIKEVARSVEQFAAAGK